VTNRGDNKLGMTIMLMKKAWNTTSSSEDQLSGGYGSQNVLMADPDFSKNLKEQFLDRKQMGSVNKKKQGLLC
jgi:hypothetical protein